MGLGRAGSRSGVLRGTILRISDNIKKTFEEGMRVLHIERPFMRTMRAERVTFLILGSSGMWKSSFIAAVTGQNIPIGHGITPCTRDINTIKFGDRIEFIDTPATDDTRDVYSELQVSRIIRQRKKDASSPYTFTQSAVIVLPAIC
ncbi:hypothetical protein JAAARDRAFT_422768 [Jaapia argillacea MUCL 33604]|uniref:G domain-containing protein n=1 Tax=Jaapia argillacea MUCL 33604 TaxID=933084 RepID=A0A067PTV2_9AGAM|nr:hypothetical protein JAAARDRAFT_422768 [Jaapia argillacea MUCL 33604]